MMLMNLLHVVTNINVPYNQEFYRLDENHVDVVIGLNWNHLIVVIVAEVAAVVVVVVDVLVVIAQKQLQQLLLSLMPNIAIQKN